ncbi:MAG: hypothetical protein VX265_16020, partial [Myxococcota bacterium]|nr:hypothetical protein [Myxococcota bacterium]
RRVDGPASGWRITSCTAGGAWAGYQLGRIAAPVADGTTLPTTGLLLGSVSGLTAGLLVRPAIADGPTWATVDGAVLMGHVAGTALSNGFSLHAANDRRVRAGLELGLGLTAGGVTRWRLERAPEQANGARLATGSLYGSAIGLALPALLSDGTSGSLPTTGVGLGLAGGYLAGALLPVPPGDPRAATSGLAWSLAGGTLLGGAGARVAGPAGAPLGALGVIAGSTSGLIGGIALQPRYGDPTTRPLGTPLFFGISQLQAAATAGAVGAWARARRPDDPTAATELGLIAFGASSAAGLAVPAFGTLTTGGSAAAGSAGAWATGLSSTAGIAADLPGPTRRATAAIIGEMGTITAGVALAGRTGPSVPAVAWVDGMGIVGLGLGTLVSFAVTPEPTWRAAGALAGSALGLGAGFATVGRWEVRSMATPALPRWPLQRPSRWRAHLLPGPWFGENDTPGVSLTLQLEEVRP